MYSCLWLKNFLAALHTIWSLAWALSWNTHMLEAMLQSLRTCRGQMPEDEVEDNLSRPRTKFRPRGLNITAKKRRHHCMNCLLLVVLLFQMKLKDDPVDTVWFSLGHTSPRSHSHHCHACVWMMSHACVCLCASVCDTWNGVQRRCDDDDDDDTVICFCHLSERANEREWKSGDDYVCMCECGRMSDETLEFVRLIDWLFDWRVVCFFCHSPQSDSYSFHLWQWRHDTSATCPS